MNRVVLFLVFALSSTALWAQQDPTYTQYTFNPFAFNPAYAGLHDMSQASMVIRKQNAGLKGSPTTISANAHTSLPFDNAGIGINIVEEIEGVKNDFQANISLAYRIKSIGGDKALSFGLQGGVFSHGFDYTLLNPSDANDPFFPDLKDSRVKPTIGAGVFYNTEDYYVGFSAPRLLDVKFDVLNTSGDSTVRYSKHYYFTGGMLLNPNWGESVKLKPSFLLRFLDNAPSSLDLGASVILNDMVWAGASFRASLSDIVPSSINLYGQLQATDALKLGLAYDFPTNFNLARFPTFEVMANINFAAFGFQSVKVTYF